MTWDLKELRTLVNAVHGPGRLELLRPSIDGVGARQDLARYHFSEAKRQIAEATEGRDDSDIMASFVFGVSDSDGAQLIHSAKFQAWANTVACLQSIHAAIDPISHVVHYSLAAKLMKPKDISLKNVLPQVGDSTLRTLLSSLLTERDSVYLEDLVNRSKHRAVFPVAFGVDNTGTVNPPYGLVLQRFEHRLGYPHGQRFVSEALPAIYNRHSRLIVDSGRRINELLRTML